MCVSTEVVSFNGLFSNNLLPPWNLTVVIEHICHKCLTADCYSQFSTWMVGLHHLDVSFLWGFHHILSHWDCGWHWVMSQFIISYIFTGPGVYITESHWSPSILPYILDHTFWGSKRKWLSMVAAILLWKFPKRQIQPWMDYQKQISSVPKWTMGRGSQFLDIPQSSLWVAWYILKITIDLSLRISRESHQRSEKYEI